MSENASLTIVCVTGIICATVLIFLFGGQPDLHDVLIERLRPSK